MIEMHGLFQMPYYAHHLGLPVDGHLAYRDHRWFDSCTRFCRDRDQRAFDPAYPTRPLAHFESLVREIFTHTPFNRAVLDPERAR